MLIITVILSLITVIKTLPLTELLDDRYMKTNRKISKSITEFRDHLKRMRDSYSDEMIFNDLEEISWPINNKKSEWKEKLTIFNRVQCSFLKACYPLRVNQYQRKPSTKNLKRKRSDQNQVIHKDSFIKMAINRFNSRTTKIPLTGKTYVLKFNESMIAEKKITEPKTVLKIEKDEYSKNSAFKISNSIGVDCLIYLFIFFFCI